MAKDGSSTVAILVALGVAGIAAWFLFFRNKAHAASSAPSSGAGVVAALPRVVPKNGTDSPGTLDLAGLVGLGSKLTGVKLPALSDDPLPLSIPEVNSDYGTPPLQVRTVRTNPARGIVNLASGILGGSR